MPTDVWIANSHRWVYDRLFELTDDRVAGVRFVETRREAEIVIYLEPPWPDPVAPDPLHRFRPRDLMRTFVYSQRDFPVRWAPGLYASLPMSHAGAAFGGAFYVAHHHREQDGLYGDLEAARLIDTDLLWSFVGTAENSPVRDLVLQLKDVRGLVRDTKRFSDVVRWNWATTHRDEGRRAFNDYAEMIGRSKFVICPRGRGASSMRLFEVLQVGRCPVIVSDEWLPPPLVDWAACSIRSPRDRSVRSPRSSGAESRTPPGSDMRQGAPGSVSSRRRSSSALSPQRVSNSPMLPPSRPELASPRNSRSPRLRHDGPTAPHVALAKRRSHGSRNGGDRQSPRSGGTMRTVPRTPRILSSQSQPGAASALVNGDTPWSSTRTR